MIVLCLQLVSYGFYSFTDDTNKIQFKSNMKFLIHDKFSRPLSRHDLTAIKLPSCIEFSSKIKQVKLIPISDCFQYQSHFVERITNEFICVKGLSSKLGHVVSPACDGG